MKSINLFVVTLSAVVALSFSACATGANISQSKGLAVSSGSASSSSSSSTVLFSKGITGRKQALVVGVSDYAGDRSDLGGIERDVAKMKRLFEGWGFEVKVLFNGGSMQIVDYLSKYGSSLSSDDYFAFYYSGHGSHKADENGDEADGQDETLVLSDGIDNKHLIDDILFAKFNGIKAKKMIFFDSCHSGTVFRSLNGKSQPKTISPNEVKKSFSKGLSVGISTKKSDKMDSDSEYIVMSSSQDNEESLATPTGSLFTNSLSEIFSDKNANNMSLDSINQTLTKKVIAYAHETEGTPHHPNISFSKSYSGSSTLRDFVGKKSIPHTPQVLTPPTPIPPAPVAVPQSGTPQDTLNTLMSSGKMERVSLDYSKTAYSSGESVEFTINTGATRGYLTIFYVDSNDVTVLYPNPFVQGRELQGRYSFPKDLSGGKFELEAYKACGSCKEEKTAIYTLLSSEPVSDIKKIQSKGGLTSFARGSSESKMVTRAVRIKAMPTSSSSFRPQLGKYEFIVR